MTPKSQVYFYFSPSHLTYFQALQQELAYASYLSIQTVILPAPRNRFHVASYARIINSCLKNVSYIYLSVRLPIYDPTILHSHSEVVLGPSRFDPSTASHNNTEMSSDESEMSATWEMWDLIRSICDYNTRLTLST